MQRYRKRRNPNAYKTRRIFIRIPSPYCVYVSNLDNCMQSRNRSNRRLEPCCRYRVRFQSVQMYAQMAKIREALLESLQCPNSYREYCFLSSNRQNAYSFAKTTESDKKKMPNCLFQACKQNSQIALSNDSQRQSCTIVCQMSYIVQIRHLFCYLIV